MSGSLVSFYYFDTLQRKFTYVDEKHVECEAPSVTNVFVDDKKMGQSFPSSFEFLCV